MNPWLVLLVAGVFEIVWALSLAASDGLSKPAPAAVTVVALLVSMLLLARAVQSLPIGTAYAVWTGIGAVGAAVGGVLLFDEPATAARGLFVGLVVVGIVGLELTA
ncbi:DMT family transporter [Halomarina salina]|uniref:DMT family transporter n=1 Tax=Halomarina salina TaxID=1872699 RepID=A0ABD5RH11_9EURY|nr:SMR family transporter [Halomarina salina]